MFYDLPFDTRSDADILDAIKLECAGLYNAIVAIDEAARALEIALMRQTDQHGEAISSTSEETS